MELMILGHFEAQDLGLDFNDIHYYHPKCPWSFGKNGKFKKEDILDFCFVEGDKVISVLEVWVCENNHEIQISFVSTHPNFTRKGLASRLYDSLITWMKLNHSNKKIYRGYPGVNCPGDFTNNINNKLENNQIPYYFGDST